MRFYFWLFLVLGCNSVVAQRFELGKISVKELEEKKHPSDSAAVGAVLYNKAKTSFTYSIKDGFSAVHEYEIRIKIYKKEGLYLANYEVPYYIGYENLRKEVLDVTDGVTYNLEAGKIRKDKLTGEGTFKEKVNENWKTTTIALPNVKVGSVIEFKYTLKSQNLVSFPEFHFQREIPVNYAELKTIIPVLYIYKPISKGFLEIKTDQKISDGYQNYEGQYGATESLSYKQLTSVHSLSDIPALKNENFVDNKDNYRSSINYELELIRYPNQPDKNFSQTWEGVAKTIYKSDEFGKELKTRDYFEGDLRLILKDTEAQEDKLNKIFNYVKSKMVWNDKYGIFTDKGVKKAYLDRTGNVAEINFILIGMLNSAGIIANPVLLSTIKNGVATFPNRTAFNYVIAAAEIDGKITLLDAANKFTAPNILPTNTLNWQGRLVKENGESKEINLVPEFNSRNSINMVVKLEKEGTVYGKVRSQKAEYEAFAFREKYAGLNKEKYVESLEDKFGRIEIKDYVLENETNLESPIQEIFDFISNNHSEVIGDKVYINPLLFYTPLKNPFLEEERTMPIYFGHPIQNKYTVNIEIPEGYAIESVPKPILITTGEDVGSLKYNSQVSGNRIQISVIFEINKMLVASDFYPILKDFYKKIIEKQNEKIVLKKIS